MVAAANNINMYSKLQQTIKDLSSVAVPEERKSALKQLASYLREKLEKHEPIALNFICTHNSRRSHLGQIWAQVAAAHYGIETVCCYSGGTEATAMYPSIVNALTSQGMEIKSITEGSNPVYAVRYDANTPPIICFSKKYDHFYNPTSAYHAVMTCSHADENCPIITGAERRTAITYLDPKISDGTGNESAKYLERSEQIASEMLFAFGLVV